MHKSQQYIATNVYPRINELDRISKQTLAYVISNTELTTLEAQQLNNNLHEDGVDYLFSATVSLGEAINGIDRKFFTWSTVKLYYSIFYAFRAYLAFEGYCLFYLRRSPYTIKCSAGELAKIERGNTHKLILGLFAEKFPKLPLVSEPIDSQKPIEWLKRLREEANYKNSRFFEPNEPAHFIKINEIGVREACLSYAQEDDFTFDKDHAVLAYPVKALMSTYDKYFSHTNTTPVIKDIDFLSTAISDRVGQLTDFQEKLFRSMATT